jgi:hypothetical protein
MATKADFNWKGNDLYYGPRKILRIVRDQKYPNMWRIEFPDGKLSDMVNRTRAKDAAMAHGLRMIDPGAYRKQA